MIICDEAWEKFILYAKAVYNGSKDYNAERGQRKVQGSTQIGNREAEIFDVFNFWREDFLGGQVYSKEYLDQMVQQAIEEEDA